MGSSGSCSRSWQQRLQRQHEGQPQSRQQVRQHRRQHRQQRFWQQPDSSEIRSSQGFSECIHSGRKFQVCSFPGRMREQRDCRMLRTTTTRIRKMMGTPTPTSTGQPASERPNTASGIRKKKNNR